MNYEFTPFHRNTPDEELLNDLREVAKQLNKKTVTIDEYNKYGQYHATTLTRRFGSWFRCLEIAELEPSRSRLNISEAELFQNLQEIWCCLGRQPRYHEIKKPLSKFSVGTYEKRYGTFYNALNAFIKDIDGEVNKTKPQKGLCKTENPRSINYRTRFKVMQRDNFKCVICGLSPANNSGVILHIDHIVSCAKGGTAEIDNLQTLCSKCNLGKSDLDM